MKTFEGLDLKIFTDNVEQSAIDQILELMQIPVFHNSKVRIMPDVHSGKSCVIGFTANLGDKVIPNVVGVDIGCALLVTKLDCKEIDLPKLDEVINSSIPNGRGKIHDYNTYNKYPEQYKEAKELVLSLDMYRNIKNVKDLYRSIGTLGGGNHFIEIDKGEDGSLYLVIHTGSRNLGTQVADYYQKLAVKNMQGWDDLMVTQNKMIEEYKAQGRRAELQSAIARLHSEWRAKKLNLPKELCYLEGEYRDLYLHDMAICQKWSKINRRLIRSMILDGMGIGIADEFETMHNYIEIETNMIRKGAVSAKEGEILIIPINMRDGSLICRGKGNEDFNWSGPHGAGRIMSRAEAFQKLKMEDFTKSMDGIYTTSVCESTIDEAPMVYKPMDEIIENIKDTVDVLEVIKPIYNFKASDGKGKFD